MLILCWLNQGAIKCPSLSVSPFVFASLPTAQLSNGLGVFRTDPIALVAPEMSLAAASSVVPAFVTPSAFGLRCPPWQQHGDSSPAWSRLPVGGFSAKSRTLRDSAVKAAFGGAITSRGSAAFSKGRNIKMQVEDCGGMYILCLFFFRVPLACLLLL